MECERIKQQQKRQQKQNSKEISELNNQSNKNVEEPLHNHKSYKYYQKRFKTIDDCIKVFHSSISVGPLYVCTYCHQTWFRKSVSMLKNSHIPTQIRRLYCTKFTSVNNEEWVSYKFKKIVGRVDFSDQFRKIIVRYKRIGYNINIMRQSACLVFNPITVNNFASLFNCTPVGRASDSMMAPT